MKGYLPCAERMIRSKLKLLIHLTEHGLWLLPGLFVGHLNARLAALLRHSAQGLDYSWFGSHANHLTNILLYYNLFTVTVIKAHS